ncbi:MAG: hypothetical protein OEZ34_16115 [Spirochaetia bacterium]|nr:hypothetical protein [Spirochaetia bacterium]
MKIKLSIFSPLLLLFFANCVHCHFHDKPGMKITPGHLNQFGKMRGGHPGKGRFK